MVNAYLLKVRSRVDPLTGKTHSYDDLQLTSSVYSMDRLMHECTNLLVLPFES